MLILLRVSAGFRVLNIRHYEIALEVGALRLVMLRRKTSTRGFRRTT